MVRLEPGESLARYASTGFSSRGGRPPVGIKNLFYLLGYGSGITSWTEERFPYEGEPDLLAAVAHLFEAEVSRASRRGLVRGYRAKHETLVTLRGRIDVAGQTRVRQGRPFPLECSFEEFTEDVDLNRIVKAAIRRLLRVPRLSPDTLKRLRFRHRAFGEVASVSYGRGTVSEVRFDRLNEHWRPAAELARLILDQKGLRDEAGGSPTASFTVDMNVLFERFITAVVGREARKIGLRLVAQAPRRLSDGVNMRPDLVLRVGDSDVAVGDAKYKVPETGGPPNEDLYQLLAYCVSLGLGRGLLIYAGGPERRYPVERAGVVLEATGVDLTGSPESIESSAREAARLLLEHAGVSGSGALHMNAGRQNYSSGARAS